MKSLNDVIDHQEREYLDISNLEGCPVCNKLDYMEVAFNETLTLHTSRVQTCIDRTGNVENRYVHEPKEEIIQDENDDFHQRLKELDIGTENQRSFLLKSNNNTIRI